MQSLQVKSWRLRYVLLDDLQVEHLAVRVRRSCVALESGKEQKDKCVKSRGK